MQFKRLNVVAFTLLALSSISEGQSLDLLPPPEPPTVGLGRPEVKEPPHRNRDAVEREVATKERNLLARRDAHLRSRSQDQNAGQGRDYSIPKVPEIKVSDPRQSAERK